MPAAENFRQRAADWLGINRALTPEEMQARTRNDYAAAFATDEGRRVLIDIAVRGGMFAVSMTHPGLSDMTHFNEGRRDLALTIVQMARMSPEDLIGLASARIDAGTAETREPEEDEE